MPGVATAVELVDSLERSCPDAIRLAKQLSLAVSIEPALLRRARIEARPSMDVSVESILWFSSLVESRSLNGIALYPEVAAFLRETLVRESGEALVRSKPSLVESARKIVYQAHRSAPATIRLHEELIWLELTVRDEGGVALEGLLMDALVRLLSDSARNASIARWISASGVELPDAVRHTSTFQALDVLSAAVLRREGPSKLSASASGAFIDVPRRYLDKMSRTTLWVAITSDAFVIQSTSAPGFQPVPAPRTNPVLVEVAVDEEDVVLDVDPHDLQVLHRDPVASHVARGAHPLEDAGRPRGRADRARSANVVRAVRLRARREVVALDRALKALALRGARDLDLLPDLERVDGHGVADEKLADLVAKLLDVAHRRGPGLLEVPALRPGEVLLLRRAERELDGLVAVDVVRPDGRDRARPCLEHGDALDGPVVEEELGHAELLCEDRGHHVARRISMSTPAGR